MTTETWVRDYEQGIEYLENRGGVDRFRAPKPPRRHRCTAQTRGYMSGAFVERCACGAIRMDRDGWMEKNGQRDRMPFSLRWHIPVVVTLLFVAFVIWRATS